MKCRPLMTLPIFLLAGCATQPGGISTDQVTKFREQGVSIGNVTGASTVMLQTKGKAIGGFLLSTVAASAVASNPAFLSPLLDDIGLHG